MQGEIGRNEDGLLAEQINPIKTEHMSTLAEIEAAIEKLPEADVAALQQWLATRRISRVSQWNGKGTGIVKQMGGVDEYLKQVRNDDSR